MGLKSLRNTVFGLAASNYPYLDTLPDSLPCQGAKRWTWASEPDFVGKSDTLFDNLELLAKVENHPNGKSPNFQNLTWPNLQASTDNLSSFSQLNYFNVVLTNKKKQLE